MPIFPKLAYWFNVFTTKTSAKIFVNIVDNHTWKGKETKIAKTILGKRSQRNEHTTGLSTLLYGYTTVTKCGTDTEEDTHTAKWNRVQGQNLFENVAKRFLTEV